MSWFARFVSLACACPLVLRQTFLVLCSIVGRREEEGGVGGYFVDQLGDTGSVQKKTVRGSGIFFIQE